MAAGYNHGFVPRIDAVTHLADSGRADRDRLAVRGRSPGGFVVLSALAFHRAHPQVRIAVPRPARRPYPDAADTYEARSPVLVFRKPDSGVVEFCGLCVPDHLEVRAYPAEDGTQVPNYQFHFSILNTDTVPVTWLHERALQNDGSTAPDVWRQWVQTGKVDQWPTGEPLDQSGRVHRYETSEIRVSDAFRADTLDRYGHECALTGIQEGAVLDLAHILPRSQRPDLAEHPENVLVLSSLHHRAFDAALFTIDSDYRIRTSPSFDPTHPFLRETILDRHGEQLAFPPDAQIRPTFLEKFNAGLSWL
jgi:hypothetical protein